jgi:hypothetical protein
MYIQVRYMSLWVFLVSNPHERSLARNDNPREVIIEGMMASRGLKFNFLSGNEWSGHL